LALATGCQQPAADQHGVGACGGGGGGGGGGRLGPQQYGVGQLLVQLAPLAVECDERIEVARQRALDALG
jgi:hypothetical protein